MNADSEAREPRIARIQEGDQTLHRGARSVLAMLVFSLISLVIAAGTGVAETRGSSLQETLTADLSGKTRDQAEAYLRDRGFVYDYRSRDLLLTYPEGMVATPTEDLSGRIYTGMTKPSQGWISTNYKIEIDISLGGNVSQVRVKEFHIGP